MAKSDALRLVPQEGQDGTSQRRGLELHVSGGAVVRGSFRPPADKSIAHRTAMLAAICEGQSFISGYPDSEDCASTARCLRALGAGLHKDGDALVVSGRGLRGLREPEDVLDAGNSGTTMRLLSGLLAGQNGLFILTGDQSLRRRPMGRITQPLRAMGAKVDGRADGTLAPLVIRGAGREPLRACRHVLPVASAQVKSCILLAGLYAEGTTVVVEPAPSRDHTERMLRFVGVRVKGGATGDIRGPASGDSAPDPSHTGTEPLYTSGPAEISIEGGQAPRPFKLRIPGDPSSAAFFLAAAAVLPGSTVTAMHVCMNPTRLGFMRAIARMGAAVTFEPVPDGGCEPTANIHVEHQDLIGIDIPPDAVPSMIDEIPLLAVVACLAKTPSSVSGAGELRVKETDRLAAIVGELSKMGARIEQSGDSLRIWPSRLRGARVSARGDHRMAMALTVAGLAANGTTIIEGYDCVAVSYRSFADDLALLIGQRFSYEGTNYG
ncbi:MAG: 3-phosphoshikimate 1-carboxyvinyltransferase [Bacillota bacterium]